MQGRLQEAAGPALLTETGSERAHPATTHGSAATASIGPAVIRGGAGLPGF